MTARLATKSQSQIYSDYTNYGTTRPWIDVMKYSINNGHDRWNDGGGFAACEKYLGTLSDTGGAGWLTEGAGMLDGHTYYITILAGNIDQGADINALFSTVRPGTYKVVWTGWASVNFYGDGVSGPGNAGWIAPAVDGGEQSTTIDLVAGAHLIVQVKKDTVNPTFLNDLAIFYSAWEVEWRRGDVWSPDMLEKFHDLQIIRHMPTLNTVGLGTESGDGRWGWQPTVDIRHFGHETDRCYGVVPPSVLAKLANLTLADQWYELSSRCTPAVMLDFYQAVYDGMTVEARAKCKIHASAYNEAMWNDAPGFTESFYHLHWYWAENIECIFDTGVSIPKLNFKITAGNTLQTEPPGQDISYLDGGQQLHFFYNGGNNPSAHWPNENYYLVRCHLKGGTIDEIYLHDFWTDVVMTLKAPDAITYKASAYNCGASGAAQCSLESWHAAETVFGRAKVIRSVNGQAGAGANTGAFRITGNYVNPNSYPAARDGGSGLGKKLYQLIDGYAIAPYFGDYNGWAMYGDNGQDLSDEVWKQRELYAAKLLSSSTFPVYGTALVIKRVRITLNADFPDRDDILILCYEGGPTILGYNATGPNEQEWPWYFIPNVANNTIEFLSYSFNPNAMTNVMTDYNDDGDEFRAANPVAIYAETRFGNQVTVRLKTGTTYQYFIYQNRAAYDAESPANYQNPASAQKSTVIDFGSSKVINFTHAMELRAKRVAATDDHDIGYDFNAIWIRACREVDVPELGITETPYNLSQYTLVGHQNLWVYEGAQDGVEKPLSGRVRALQDMKKFGVRIPGAASPTYPSTFTAYQFITNPLLTTWTPLPNWDGTPVKVRVIGNGGIGGYGSGFGTAAGASGGNYAESAAVVVAANAPLHVGSSYYASPTSGTYFNAASLAAAHAAGPALACGASSGVAASGVTGGVSPDPATFDCGDIKFKGGKGGEGTNGFSDHKSGGGGAAGPAGPGGDGGNGNGNAPGGGGANSGAAPAPTPSGGIGNGAASINITTALNSQVATAGGVGVVSGAASDGSNGSGGGATQDTAAASGSGGHGTEFSPVHGSGGAQGAVGYFSTAEMQNTSGYGAAGAGTIWGGYGMGGLIVVEQTITRAIPVYGTTLDPGNSLTTGNAFWYQLLGNVTTYADASGHNPALTVTDGARRPTVQSTPYGNSICPLSGPNIPGNHQRTDSSVITYAGAANLTCSTGDGQGDFSFAFAGNPMSQSDAGHTAFGIWDLSVGPGPDGGGFDVYFNGTPASSAATPGSLLIRLGGRIPGPLTPSSCQIAWANQVDGDYHVWQFNLDYATNTASLLRDGIDQGAHSGGVSPLIYLGPTGTTKIWVGNQSNANNEWAGPDCNLLFIAAWNRKLTAPEQARLVLATMFDGLI